MKRIDYYKTKDTGDLVIILRTSKYDIVIGVISTDRYTEQKEVIGIIDGINQLLTQEVADEV